MSANQARPLLFERAAIRNHQFEPTASCPAESILKEIRSFFRPSGFHEAVISSIFQKPAAQPGVKSPFRRPEATAVEPRDGFRASEPMPSFKPPILSEAANPQILAQNGLKTSVAASIPALPAPLAAAYQAVLSVLSDSPSGPAQLAQLLEQGKLNESTLENLHSLTQQPRASGLDGAALTRETVAILSNPDQTVWQGDRFTCGASNLERQWAESPSNFTALVAGLSSPEGTAQLGSGFTLRRAHGSVGEDGSGRNATDRLLQSTIMATAGAARGDYDVASDRFGTDNDRGLKISEIAAMTALTQNQPQVVIKYDSKSAPAAQSLIAQLKPGETFQTAMTNWDGKEHMLLFQGQSEGVASYFDPFDHTQHMIPLNKFLWKTEFLVLPQSLAERVNFAPESIHSSAAPN